MLKYYIILVIYILYKIFDNFDNIFKFNKMFFILFYPMKQKLVYSEYKAICHMNFKKPLKKNSVLADVTKFSTPNLTNFNDVFEFLSNGTEEINKTTLLQKCKEHKIEVTKDILEIFEIIDKNIISKEIFDKFINIL